MRLSEKGKRKGRAKPEKTRGIIQLRESYKGIQELRLISIGATREAKNRRKVRAFRLFEELNEERRLTT